MSYFLYLKQSFRRRPMWHLNIYVIITCALILPLLFSIYLDSSSYGWSQQLISMAKGETFHIANAGEKDVEVFGISKDYRNRIGKTVRFMCIYWMTNSGKIRKRCSILVPYFKKD